MWDAAAGRERATLGGHTEGVFACAVSPDGSLIVSASEDKTLKVWDAATGRERATLKGHTELVKACAVSPDGSFIVSASEDRILKVWDAATGEKQAELPLPGTIRCMDLHPSQPLVTCGDEWGNVYLLDFAGIEYGPIVVTAVNLGDGPNVRCPACSQQLPLEENWLGKVIDCPRAGCNDRMRVNPFVTVVRSHTGPSRRRWWQFWVNPFVVGRSRKGE